MPGAMLLHEAIDTVLRDAGRSMHADVIAAEINRRGIYERRDDQPLGGAQVRARVAKPKYRDGFVVTDGIVGLA